MRTFRDFSENKENPPIETPSELKVPVFLMNFPLNMRTSSPNNAWMKDLSPKDRKVNYQDAFLQFYELYSFITQHNALVYLLPSGGNFQDQEYVANLGIHLPHLGDTIIVANFKSPPRKGEDKIGESFFELMKYKVYRPSTHWEGEADLKYLRDNLYVGGHGIRTDVASYHWMEKKFDMEIIPVEMRDKYLYHMDTMYLRISKDKITMPTEAMQRADVKKLEKYVEIVDMPKEIAYSGVLNGIMLGDYVMLVSPKHLLGRGEDNPKLISKLGKFTEKVTGLMKKEPKFFNLFEFQKSGADLGCLIMHLNYSGY